MKTSTRKIKSAIATFLVVLISINSFAAIVSDNDGAAFVTKAEFDALKKDFADQIQNYNDSIDSKIDGLIGNYLAGIRLNTRTKVKLISEIDVNNGSGYRAWNPSDDVINRANRNTNDWIFGLTSSVVYRQAWADVNTGEIDTLWANQAKTSKDAASGTFKWYISHYDVAVTLSLANWATVPVGTMVLSGTATRSFREFPQIFVDENGRVDEFSDKSTLTIDMRKARGANGATDNARYWLLAGVTSGNKPAANTWTINELYDGLPVKCLNSQDSVGATGFGNVLTVLEKAIHEFNPNLFIWNPGENLTTAYASSCEKVQVNHEANVANFNGYGYSINLNQTRLVWGAQANGLPGQGTHMVPLVSFEYAKEHTNLPDEAFATVDGFPWGRLKQKYLQLSDFKSITDNTRNLYVYEGLPIYTAEREGNLEFTIKILKSSWTTTDVARESLYNDPNNNMKVRIKNTPFTLNDDYSGCLDLTINGITAKEGSINAGDETTISIELEKGKTYYMRWYCDGYDYGGEIVFLGNAFEIS